MIDLDKLRANPIQHIVSHENCADGIASAIILRTYWPDASVTWMQYNTTAHKEYEPQPGTIFVDFSPHPSRLQACLDTGVVVLDHHKSAKDAVLPFVEAGLGEFADEKAEPGICGASLAFRLVQRLNGRSPAVWTGLAEFAALAGVYDTYQRKDPRWLQACEQVEALTFLPIETLLPSSTHRGLNLDTREELQIGKVLFERKIRSAQNALETGLRWTSPKGRKVLAFEGVKRSTMAADQADALDSVPDLVTGFGFKAEANANPILIFSNRSHTGFDCSAFAKAFGGGGHTAAAGFSIPVQFDGHPDLWTMNPYTTLRLKLERYEMHEGAWLELLATASTEMKDRLKRDSAAVFQELVRQFVKKETGAEVTFRDGSAPQD